MFYAILCHDIIMYIQTCFYDKHVIILTTKSFKFPSQVHSLTSAVETDINLLQFTLRSCDRNLTSDLFKWLK